MPKRRKRPEPEPLAAAGQPPQKPPSKPPSPAAAADGPGDAYDRRREAARARNAQIARTGRDIGPLPPPANATRRAACERDAELFLKTYFPGTFTLPFSNDHRRVISAGQTAVLLGGLFAFAMARGSGKTSICEGLAVWALVYGHRSFIALIGSDAGHAQQMLESIKTELECNELLEADFPEVCTPIVKLEGIANRCKGQLCQGERTLVTWTRGTIILPTIAGSKASGAILKCCGITGRIRGLKHKRADGSPIRPDLVIADDPQTDESAHSESQSESRERILAGAVLGLAGPGKQISGLMPCTVIARGDMADRILDRTLHPEWHGERCRLLYELPGNTDLWAQYAELRAESMRGGGQGEQATEFYRQHRAEMDAGAVVGWPERYRPDELSAVQHAMNLLQTDELAFWAEYQNDPRSPAASDHELTAEAVAALANGMARGLVPIWATRLTAFVDVQRSLLYWAVCAWADDFTGQVIAYGAWPPQRRAYFALRDARPTLQSVTPAGGMEAQLRAGLDAVAGELLGREWKREGGATARIAQALVDANWGESTDAVYEFCRRSPHAALLVPSHGKGIGASSPPLTDRKTKPKPGERLGTNWFLPLPAKRAKQHALFDANWWKSFVAARCQVPAGGRGRLELFGKPADHRLFADHLTAERGELVTHEKSGRQVVEWRMRGVGRDNHWLDCVVGCAVGASILGAAVPELPGTRPVRPQRVRFSEMRARSRQAKEAKDRPGPAP